MAVFAVMAAIVLGGIRLGTKSWDAAAERSEAVDEMRVAQALLRRQLSSALPIAVSSAGSWTLAFDGSEESVRFVSELPGYVSGGGVHYVTLELAGGTAAGQDLVLRWRPLHALEEDAPPDEAVLARNVGTLRLRYFGARTRRASPEWLESWRDLKTMPLLMTVSVERENGESWPELAVALEVNAMRFITSGGDAGAPAPGAIQEDSAAERSS
jgi:hypothetical protein